MDRTRYLRQILLSGFGEAGQLVLATSTASVPETGFARTVGERYAVRCGFGGTRADSQFVAPVALASNAADAVLRGAWAALASAVTVARSVRAQRG